MYLVVLVSFCCHHPQWGSPLISFKQAKFRTLGTTSKIFKLHQDHFQVPHHCHYSSNCYIGQDGGRNFHVNTSRYLVSFISFGDRKLLEPKEPFSGPLYRPHGRFPRPYPTTSPTRFWSEADLMAISSFRQPKDRSRRISGVRTSYIPHPDSIAGNHHQTAFDSDLDWCCVDNCLIEYWWSQLDFRQDQKAQQTEEKVAGIY